MLKMIHGQLVSLLVLPVFLTLSHAVTQALDCLQFDIELSAEVNPTSHSRLLKRSELIDSEISLGDGNFIILLNATLGTPPQDLQFTVDTGSSDVVVTFSSSNVCQQNRTTNCNQGAFNKSLSSTFNKLDSTFNLTYADGTTAVGHYSTDNFVISGITIDTLQFALAQTVNITTELERLYLDGITKINGYSIWFDGINAESGKLAFGAIDTNKFAGSLTTLPILPNQQYLAYEYPTINVSSISTTLDGTNKNVPNSSFSAILDTGTSTISLPNDTFYETINHFGAVYDQSYGIPLQDVSSYNTNASLDIQFGDTIVQIPVADLTYTFDDDHVAYLLLIGDSEFNILGIPFIRNAYVVFDYSHNQVSLAQTVRTSEANNLTLIGPNGVTGLVSTANVTTNVGTSSNDSAASGLSTGAKLGIGIGIGLGVPISFISIALIFFIRRKKTKSDSTPVEADDGSNNKVNKYEKAELPGVGADSKMAEKTELPAENAKYELESRNVIPVELPGDLEAQNEMLGSVKEPKEMSAEKSATGDTRSPVSALSGKKK